MSPWPPAGLSDVFLVRAPVWHAKYSSVSVSTGSPRTHDVRRAGLLLCVTEGNAVQRQRPGQCPHTALSLFSRRETVRT